MEAKVSEVLELILSFLALEGSFETEETEDGVFVSIETQDAGKLIGAQGQTLAALQLLVNQIVSRQVEDSKRVVIDIANWRKSKEEELAHQARSWAEKVLSEGKEMELLPMPSWQRRIVHMTISGTKGVKSESIGEGIDRRIVIKLDEDGSLEKESEAA